eukprot:gnl/TRDRNA2_/TRDRNA2_44592_c0_seq1.p1 gnl/TRDRNA2_/TRDRNA2_44592_c0~~gnl/TRDRNA2_/TRDRNA2_44592_c0_seq1.p1  ORF type:complete len:374 (+),score=43.44 gnl/TRDRNA2_/TRDRNA2_44592_c0_seq1:76-1122(+)
MAALRALFLATCSPAAMASTAMLTKMVWVENVYPSDFDFRVSYSKVHSSDLTTGESKGYLMSLRPWKHIVSPWVRVEGDEMLRAYNDNGYFVEFSPSTGSYSLSGGYKVESEKGDGLFADFPAHSKNRRVFATSTIGDSVQYLNVRSIDAHTGATLKASVGIVDLGGTSDQYIVCSGLYKSWTPASEQLYIARNFCGHSQPGRLYSFDTSANRTKTLYTFPTTGESFCAFASRPSTGELFALVETHNTTAFPDPDCQNLSGTMTALKVIKIGLDGKATDIYSAPLPSSTIVAGGPMDDAAGIWHLLVGGGVKPLDLAAGKVLYNYSADIEGDYPILVGSASEESTIVV